MNRHSLCLVVIVFSSFIIKNESARILAVFPIPSISHQVVFRPLTQELARRGHELTIWTADPAFPPGKTPPNLTEIDVHDASYKLWHETFVASIDGGTDPMESMRIGFQATLDLFEMQYNSKEIQNVLKTKQFDLILVEACVRVALMVSLQVKDVPVIQISSFGAVVPNFEVHGAPVNPVVYPDMILKKVYNLTVFDKIDALRYSNDLNSMGKNVYPVNEIIKKYFGNEAPTITDLEDNVDMLFLNVHPIWEGNRPVPPAIIHMGGIHTMKPEQELPEDLKTYLDSSQHGVIYMSFGTNVDPALLPPEKLNVFLNVFSKLPYDVMLKWSKDKLEGKPQNVKIFKWVPQSGLLKHPNVKLFITQGGLQSSDEAILAGVPLIAFPMLGDQWYNAQKYVYHKIGLQLDIETVTESILELAIKRVIHEKSFRKNIKQLGIIMRDEPQTSLERAVWWTEYVIRHKGAKHLRSPAANMHWAEYYMMDVVVLVVGGAVLSISVIVLISFMFVRLAKNALGLEKKQKKS